MTKLTVEMLEEAKRKVLNNEVIVFPLRPVNTWPWPEMVKKPKAKKRKSYDHSKFSKRKSQ